MASPELGPDQIETLRKQLEAERATLESQLHLGSDSARPVELDQQSVGRVSRVDAIQQQQMARAGRAQAEQLLRQVGQALQRIDSGDYGDCVNCGEPIGFARLQARPFARLCIKCQSAAESS